MMEIRIKFKKFKWKQKTKKLKKYYLIKFKKTQKFNKNWKKLNRNQRNL